LLITNCLQSDKGTAETAATTHSATQTTLLIGLLSNLHELTYASRNMFVGIVFNFDKLTSIFTAKLFKPA